MVIALPKPNMYQSLHTVQVTVTDLEQLKGLMRTLLKINGVYGVDRL
jgi:(p)ppGpp synthase/HD superfamily hydrolase